MSTAPEPVESDMVIASLTKAELKEQKKIDDAKLHDECEIIMGHAWDQVKKYISDLAQLSQGDINLHEICHSCNLFAVTQDLKSCTLSQYDVQSYAAAIEKCYGSPKLASVNNFRKSVYTWIRLNQFREYAKSYNAARKKMPNPKIGPKILMPSDSTITSHMLPYDVYCQKITHCKGYRRGEAPLYPTPSCL